jgi:hypothetical protein
VLVAPLVEVALSTELDLDLTAAPLVAGDQVTALFLAEAGDTITAPVGDGWGAGVTEAIPGGTHVAWSFSKAWVGGQSTTPQFSNTGTTWKGIADVWRGLGTLISDDADSSDNTQLTIQTGNPLVAPVFTIVRCTFIHFPVSTYQVPYADLTATAFMNLADSWHATFDIPPESTGAFAAGVHLHGYIGQEDLNWVHGGGTTVGSGFLQHWGP